MKVKNINKIKKYIIKNNYDFDYNKSLLYFTKILKEENFDNIQDLLLLFELFYSNDFELFKKMIDYIPKESKNFIYQDRKFYDYMENIFSTFSGYSEDTFNFLYNTSYYDTIHFIPKKTFETQFLITKTNQMDSLKKELFFFIENSKEEYSAKQIYEVFKLFSKSKYLPDIPTMVEIINQINKYLVDEILVNLTINFKTFETENDVYNYFIQIYKKKNKSFILRYLNNGFIYKIYKELKELGKM